MPVTPCIHALTRFIFCFKYCSGEVINMTFLQKLFSVQNDNYHKLWTILGFKIRYFDIVRYYRFNPDKFELFTKRNIIRNALVQLDGLHRLKPLDKFEYFKEEIKAFYLLKEKFEYFVFGTGRINIPQIEFTLTTQCTLRCKNCINYIPCLSKDEQKYISFNEFKLYLDNLTGAVSKIYNLLLIGGEPLLVKNLDKYLEYACRNKKVKNVWITTNGTVLMSENLVSTVKKYNKKVTIWLSNYSANKALAPVLKQEKLIEQVKLTGADLVYNKDLTWGFVSENYSSKNLKRKEMEKYFEKCLHPCLAVFDDKLFVCPRAGTFYLKNLYSFDKGECVSLKNTNKKELRRQIIDFYSRNYFSACNFCRMLEDRVKPRVMPAIQLENTEK